MFSRLIRRIHLYLGLFLAPWIAMYAISTMAMNHRKAFGDAAPRFEVEAETTFSGTLPDNDAKAAAPVLLAWLGHDGAHTARLAKDGALVVQRHDPVTPRRVTYTPGTRKVVVEKQVFRANQFLERMHRKRGFQYEYAADDIWAFTVDLTIAAILLWVLTGLWMWWELKATRRLGAVCAAAGIALFTIYLRSL